MDDEPVPLASCAFYSEDVDVTSSPGGSDDSQDRHSPMSDTVDAYVGHVIDPLGAEGDIPDVLNGAEFPDDAMRFTLECAPKDHVLPANLTDPISGVHACCARTLRHRS